MNNVKDFFQAILDWSEIWALLIPLIVLRTRQNQPLYLKPVIVYLWLALIINSVIDILAQYNLGKSEEDQVGNNVYYNIHSIVRFACFSYFFISLGQPYFSKLKKMLPVISLLFIIIIFGFVDKFFNKDALSGNLLSTEAYMLLIYCLLYYLSELRDEIEIFRSEKPFWVVTGLSIYVVINFFVFLFYNPLLNIGKINFAIQIWNVHNIAYIIFTIFITKAFYVSNPDRK